MESEKGNSGGKNKTPTGSALRGLSPQELNKAAPRPALRLLSYAPPEKLARRNHFHRALMIAWWFGAIVFLIGAAIFPIEGYIYFPFDPGSLWVGLIFSLLLSFYCVAAACSACWLRLRFTQSELWARKAWPFALVYTLGMAIGLPTGYSFDDSSSIGAAGLLFIAWCFLGPVAVGVFIMRRQDIMDNPRKLGSRSRYG